MPEIDILKMLQRSYDEKSWQKKESNVKRKVYTEESLLNLKSTQGSMKMHAMLNKKFLANGIWNPIEWFELTNMQEEHETCKRERLAMESELRKIILRDPKETENSVRGSSSSKNIMNRSSSLQYDDPSIIETSKYIKNPRRIESTNFNKVEMEKKLLSLLKCSDSLNEFENSVKDKILKSDTNSKKVNTLKDVYESKRNGRGNRSYSETYRHQENQNTSVTITDSATTTIDVLHNDHFFDPMSNRCFNTVKNVIGSTRFSNISNNSNIETLNVGDIDQLSDTMNKLRQQGSMAQANIIYPDNELDNNNAITNSCGATTSALHNDQYNFLNNVTSGFLNDTTKSMSDQFKTMTYLLLNQLQRQKLVNNLVNPAILQNAVNNQHQLAQLFTQKANVQLVPQKLIGSGSDTVTQ